MSVCIGTFAVMKLLMLIEVSFLYHSGVLSIAIDINIQWPILEICQQCIDAWDQQQGNNQQRDKECTQEGDLWKPG